MWAKEIEDAYQRWIGSDTLFDHPNDVERFYEFVWACINNPDDAPDESALGERLEHDWKLERDEHDFPHSDRSEAQSLYNHLRAFVKN